MGDNSHPNQSSSRLGLKATVGEIVEVQGGHIVRSIGRKDRHSKVCTAKGPRDRRVRLAAYTAIQFYDVQDRLGYDRPSKAVDWLIKNAKAAIDELAELPPWHPTASSAPNKYFNSGNPKKKLEEETQNEEQAGLVISNVSNGFADNSNPENSSYLPPSMGSDAISDSMKSFFPAGGSDGASSSAMQQFQSLPTQDLRLSLQSFQDPSLFHQNPSQANSQTLQGQVLLSATPLGFDGWPENNHHHHQAPELSRFQRFTPWNSTGETTAGNGGGATSAGYLFNSPPAPQPLLQQLLGHNQFIQQRGPLQSSNSSSIRAWMDPSTPDHSQHHHQIYSSSVSGIGFTPECGFSGFRIPTRIQGEEEEHDGFSDKPSSASSDSRH